MTSKKILTIYRVTKNLTIEEEYIENNSSVDWGLLLYPGENIDYKHLSHDFGSNGIKLVMIKVGTMILKEPRLFAVNSGKISKNGIPHIEGNEVSDCVGLMITRNNESWVNLEVVEKWVKQNPFSSQACCWLMDLFAGMEKWEKSSAEGRRYLFVTNATHLEEAVNVNYKIACSDLILGKINKCIESLIFCLAVIPSFAEAWCLLGDIFYLNNQLIRAKSFYKNAILSGKLRNFHDNIMILSEKYETHPKKMINEIDEYLNNK